MLIGEKEVKTRKFAHLAWGLLSASNLLQVSHNTTGLL